MEVFMTKQLSFSSVANKYMKNFREMVNNSEDKIDIANNFSLISSRILKEVFPDYSAEINDNDVIFDSSEKVKFKITERLSSRTFFQEIWNSSDLPTIIENFANSANHRYLHLLNNPQKSQTKIRI